MEKNLTNNGLKLAELTNAQRAMMDLRLPLLFASLRDAVLIENEHRIVVVANESFCKMFGVPVPPHMLVGMDCSKSVEETKSLFIDPEDFVRRIDYILADKQPVTEELIELNDGRILERDYVPIYLDGFFSGQLWQYRDVTDRVIAQRALQLREQKYRKLIENMNLGLLEVDIDEKIVYLNQSFCDMTGYEPDELMGKVASEILLPTGQNEVMKEVNERRTHGNSDVYEIKLTRKDGSNVWMLISGAPILDEKGLTSGSIGIHLNISSRKVLEKELISARLRAESGSRSREEFLAMVSHEIRTPVAAIMGLQNILTREKLFTYQKRLVDQTLIASEHLLTIINNILDFSKLSSGKMELSNTYINLSQIVENTIDMLRIRAEEKDIVLSIQYDSRLSDAHFADGPRIAQIILNLVSNAVKFTNMGYVRVQVDLIKEKDNQQDIVIQVKDTGIGIPINKQKSIFNVFSQADASVSQRFGGTGLGLSISKHLVELMDGRIWLDSEEGVGSTFHVRLTLQKGLKNQIQVPEKLELAAGQLSKTRILIAEDNEINMLIAETLLARQEAVVEKAENGKLAVDMALRTRFDLILMDIQMPEMDGITATQVLRKAGVTIPIIALTANSLTKRDDLLQEAQFTDVITKPFTEIELISKIVESIRPNSVVLNKLDGNTKTNNDNKDDLFYSLARLNKLAQGEEHFVKRMIAMAQVQFNEISARITAARQSQDWIQTSAQAHKVKATLDSLEAKSLTDLARSIENNSPSTMEESVYIDMCIRFEKVLLALSEGLGSSH
jgi:two-component system, sensor histidine kinase